MADGTKEIARQLERLVTEMHETNRRLKRIEQIVDIRRFDDLEPPPQKVVVQNMRGCVCVHQKDYEKLIERVKSIDEGQMTWNEYENEVSK